MYLHAPYATNRMVKFVAHRWVDKWPGVKCHYKSAMDLPITIDQWSDHVNCNASTHFFHDYMTWHAIENMSTPTLTCTFKFV